MNLGYLLTVVLNEMVLTGLKVWRPLQASGHRVQSELQTNIYRKFQLTYTN